MPTGPINCFGDASPVKRSFSVLRISPDISMLRWTLMPIASIGVGLNERVASFMYMPTSVRSPSRYGVTEIVLIDAVAADGELDRLVTGLLRDRLDGLRAKHHALAVNGENHVARLEAR